MRSRLMSSPASSTMRRAFAMRAPCPFSRRAAFSTFAGSMPSSSICCTPRLFSSAVRGCFSSVATIAAAAFASSMDS